MKNDKLKRIALLTVIVSILMASICACGSSSNNDDQSISTGTTTVVITDSIETCIEKADEVIEEWNEKNSDKFSASVDADEENKVYWIFIEPTSVSGKLAIANWKTDGIDFSTTGPAKTYNKVVDFFDNTGWGVYVVMLDGSGEKCWGYNGSTVDEY